jgi:hypothetical protein
MTRTFPMCPETRSEHLQSTRLRKARRKRRAKTTTRVRGAGESRSRLGTCDGASNPQTSFAGALTCAFVTKLFASTANLGRSVESIRAVLVYAPDHLGVLGVNASSNDCEVATEPKIPPCAAIIARPAA